MAIASTDYNVASPAAFVTLVQSWTLTGGVRQVPLGRDVVVQLTGGGAGFTLAESFNYQVTLRSSGPYAMNYDTVNYEFQTGGTATDLSSGVDISDCTNLRLYALKINGTCIANRVTDCTFERCWINGQEFPLTKDKDDTTGTTGLLLDANGVNGFLLKDCHFAHSHNSHTSIGYDGIYPTNVTFSGCTGDHYRHDFLKFLNGSINLIIEDTWEPRTRCRADLSHTDCIQTQGGLHTNPTLRRNVFMYGPDINGNSSSLQGYYWRKDTGSVGMEISQSVVCTNHQNAYFMENPIAGVVRSGNTANYNDCLRYDMGSTEIDQYVISMPKFGGIGGDYNIGTVPSNATNALGPNGIWLDWGDVQDGDWDHSNYTTTDYYSGIPRDTTGFEVFEPKNTAVRTHWDNANPVGAYILKQRVFELGLHPGNVGWPVAEPWTRQYNFNGSIASEYSGDYDANGDNDVGTPTAPSITGTPTISGTESVGYTLTATPASRTGSPVPTTTWQWYNSVSGAIAGATDSTYTIQSSDDGDQLYVIQTETNTVSPYTDTAQSSNTGTIGTVSAPSVVSFSPADGATGVNVSSQLVITFDQPIQAGSGNIELWRAGAVRETWIMPPESDPANHSAVITGNSITITSGHDMWVGADYHIEIDSGAIESTGGVDWGGISDGTTWNWSTSATVPRAKPITVGKPLHINGVLLLLST